MLTVERCIYDFMSGFARSYSAGYWRYFDLSNGGFYMSPPEGMYEIRISGNGFKGHMTANAAGITACLLTFSHLSFGDTSDVFAKHFHLLRDFARRHPEAGAILQAID